MHLYIVWKRLYLILNTKFNYKKRQGKIETGSYPVNLSLLSYSISDMQFLLCARHVEVCHNYEHLIVK